MMSLVSDLKLDLLAEEVVDSVYAGHNYQRLSIASSRLGPAIGHTDAHAMKGMDMMRATSCLATPDLSGVGGQAASANVSVHLDIDPAVAMGLPRGIRRVAAHLDE